MHYSRRHFIHCAITAGTAIAVCSAQLAVAENAPLEWSSRLLSLTNSASKTKPIITAAKLHPQGTWLVTAGDDHLLRVWEVTSGKLLHELSGHSDWIRALAITSAGDLLASTGNDGRVLLWDTSNWESRTLVELPHALAALDFTHDGSQLAVAGWSNQVHVYDVTNNKRLHELTGPGSASAQGDFRTLAFSPDAKLLAVGGRSGKIRIWNMSDQTVMADVPAHSQRVRSLIFSSDSTALLSAGEDGLVCLTPISQGFAGFSLPRMPCRILAIALCGENQLAVAGSDNRVHLWNLKTREQLGVLGQHAGSITTLDCAGDTLISGGYDTTLRVWTLNGSVAESNAPKNRVSARPSFRLE